MVRVRTANKSKRPEIQANILRDRLNIFKGTVLGLEGNLFGFTFLNPPDDLCIYAVKFGQGAGVLGLEHGDITVERVGELESKDATRTRIKWYCGLGLFNDLGAAKLVGLN